MFYQPFWQGCVRFSHHLSLGVCWVYMVQDLVVSSLREYEERAVHIATHPEYSARINKKILDSRTQKGGLFDTKAYAKRLVHGIRTAWEVLLSGQMAGHIYSL